MITNERRMLSIAVQVFPRYIDIIEGETELTCTLLDYVFEMNMVNHGDTITVTLNGFSFDFIKVDGAWGLK
jgi:hypothetical protein